MLIHLPQGIYSFVRYAPDTSMVLESTETGELLLLPDRELARLIRSGKVKVIELARRPDWGRPRTLIIDGRVLWSDD
jgi:hypothetical protein